jgi:ADP-ribose pyrophosphatase YjhB (NUDIX family)
VSQRRRKFPLVTVDIILEQEGKVLLIERKNPPHGWALPGGFVDFGETVSEAVHRETAEETGLRLTETRLLGVYSDPKRDPRGPTVGVVFAGQAIGEAAAADDAAALDYFAWDGLPETIAFDHRQILADYKKEKER